MLDLYFWPTPNGLKVTIMLEEAQLPYRVIPLNIGRGDQFKPEYLAINPNNRMPALVDDEPLGGGAPISVFESGAILMYLAEKAGRFWPQDPRGKYEVAQWVMWQMANQGPKSGEKGHFLRAAARPDSGDLTYALRRFDDEVNRLYGVLNNRLYDRRYLAGDEYTIADMICYPWASLGKYVDEDVSRFKHVKRWLDELAERPGVQRGMAVGAELRQANSDVSPEEQARRDAVLSHQRARPAPDES